MKKTEKVFRSRISVLLIIIMAVPTILTCISVSISIIQSERYYKLFYLAAMIFFFIFICTGIRYVISDDKLYFKVRSVSFLAYDITDIVLVKRAYKIVSSCATSAASLKQLHISLRNGTYYLISPVREEEFIEELKAVNPGIQVAVIDKKEKCSIWNWDI